MRRPCRKADLMPMPDLSRRGFALGAAALAGTDLLRPKAALALADPELRPMTGDAAPITRAERLARVAKAQALMRRNRIGAIVIEPGSSLDYFTGVQWHRSERLTAAVLPARGEAVIVTPFFEEPSVRETLSIPADVRPWQEDEDPLRLGAGALRDRGAASLPVGIEETVRFFAVDGLRKALPAATIVNAAPVVRGCRMVKTAHELALMQKATDTPTPPYRYTYPRTREGIIPAEIGAIM